MKKDLYICCTYHHTLISIIKALNNKNKSSDIILENLIPSCGELKYRLSKENIFDNVMYFNRKKVPVFKSNSRIDKLFNEHKHYKKVMRQQIDEQLKINLNDYDEIYIFNDRCVWGYYFCSSSIKYNLIEDAINYYKYIERVNARPYVQKEILDMVNPNLFKNKVKRFLNYGYFLLGQSKNAKSIEVNENSDLFIPANDKIIEVPKSKLYSQLTEEQKAIICRVMLRNEKELSEITDKSVLIITQPLRIETSVPSSSAQKAVYEDIIKEYRDNGYKIFIKPHPRDDMDYSVEFDDVTILDKYTPIETFDFYNIHPFDVAITINSSAIYELNSAKKRIMLGVEHLLPYKEYQLSLDSKCVKPAFTENCITTVLVSSNYFAPYLSVLLQSIIDNSTENYNYDLLILSKDINDFYKKTILQMAENQPNISIRIVNMKDVTFNKKLRQTSQIPIETWFRLCIPELFINYKKVLYMDTDMIVNSNIADLYNIDIGDNYIGAVVEPAAVGVFNGPVPKMTEYMKDVLKLKNPWTYFQGGLLLMNLEKIRKDFTFDSLIDFSVSYPFILFDQDVFNILFQGNVYFLPNEWNVCSIVDYRKDSINMAPLSLQNAYNDAREHPKIIHYPGSIKPWSNPTMDMAPYFWKYARRSPCYEILLHCKFSVAKQRSSKKVPKAFQNKLTFLFPKGSKRRDKIKKLILRFSK